MTYELYRVADSFALLRDAGDGEFTHVITDPPYDAHCQANQISGTTMKEHVASGGGGIPHVALPFAALTDYQFTRDIVRVAQRWGIVFGTIEGMGAVESLLTRKVYRRGAIYYRPNSMGQLTSDRPANACEAIAWLHRDGACRWNDHGAFGFYVCNSTRGKRDRHPNEKPLDLCLKLVAQATDRGDTVFDPFCGSAAIGEACLLLGRHYVGLDQHPRQLTPEEWWASLSRKARLALAQQYGLEEPMKVARRPRLPAHDGIRGISTGNLSVDWIARAGDRLAAVAFGSMDDATALRLCTARKADILANDENEQEDAA